jgi:hypothetical protein
LSNLLFSSGVLKAKRIAFSPALPAKKLRSISRLGMGVFNKVALRFPDAAHAMLPASSAEFLTFFPRTLTAANSKNGFYDWINYKKVRPEMRSPVLVGIAAGSFGKSIEGMSDAAIVAQVMAQLRASFPGLPDPITYKITRWSTDPYSLGSYSFMAPGSGRNDYNELAQPIDNAGGAPWLMLAGEAAGSWPYPSTVHGAWSAGVKSAQRIVNTRTKG